MTYKEIKEHFLNEELEFGLASDKQVKRLSEDISNEDVFATHQMYREEINALCVGFL